MIWQPEKQHVECCLILIDRVRKRIGAVAQGPKRYGRMRRGTGVARVDAGSGGSHSPGGVPDRCAAGVEAMYREAVDDEDDDG